MSSVVPTNGRPTALFSSVASLHFVSLLITEGLNMNGFFLQKWIAVLKYRSYGANF